jgi:hypothetical protein
MTHRRLFRIAAIAAITGALAQVAATVLEPGRSDVPGQAIRATATSGIWTFDRLLDLTGLFLVIGALAVADRMFTGGPGMVWSRAGRPFLAILGSLGGSAVVTGAVLKNVADAWVTAGTPGQPGYVAAYDAVSQLTDALFFAAFLAMSAYLATLAAAILTGGAYARWIGWAGAAGAILVLAGDLLVLVIAAAFIAELLGFALFLLVTAAMGITMWRQVRRTPTAADQGAGSAVAAPAQT